MRRYMHYGLEYDIVPFIYWYGMAILHVLFVVRLPPRSSMLLVRVDLTLSSDACTSASTSRVIRYPWWMDTEV